MFGYKQTTLFGSCPQKQETFCGGQKKPCDVLTPVCKPCNMNATKTHGRNSMDAEELKLWLKDRELYPRHLAELLGVSRSLVTLWTLGKRETPAWLDYALGLKSVKKDLKKMQK